MMSGSLRGVPIGVQPAWLDPKLPTEVKQYRHKLHPTDALVLTELSLAAAPSGSGELALGTLTFAAEIVTFTVSSGQPTREYTLLLTATRSDSLVHDYLFKLKVGAVLCSDQAQAIPSTGFGTAVTWSPP
jgi:hypothetical protein